MRARCYCRKCFTKSKKVRLTIAQSHCSLDPSPVSSSLLDLHLTVTLASLIPVHIEVFVILIAGFVLAPSIPKPNKEPSLYSLRLSPGSNFKLCLTRRNSRSFAHFGEALYSFLSSSCTPGRNPHILNSSGKPSASLLRKAYPLFLASCPK
ncbi:hypothetical protein AcW1_008220 [Taiwanofungus camphoratus]|nr:hypothetical protein AcV5_008517 [Antrodia cinnamomea]KAI0951085.1 hypothetical protein AcW1_008220 [Antrodia cinnamomea]KAI0955979.1 hypothetical protein AcV7_006506 [Antrodia cinnamomea]